MRRRGPKTLPNPSPINSKLITINKTSNPISFLTLHFGLLFILLFAIPISYISDEWLPTPLPSTISPSKFSEERANTHLSNIASFGIRTVGSKANEVETPQYIIDFVNTVRDEAPENVDIEAEIQRPSGSFTSWFLGGFTNVYDQVTNVVVRVSFVGPRTRQNALLVSAHFDTALGTVAASDDAANIAAMLEILRNVVHGEPLAHSIIFIFNGAEETNWQAAHGFITQHPWSSTVRSVVNLEGSGAGGRSMVVQTGPRHAWLVEAFRKVAPKPHASSLAQEIFQTKIIPGWTDFETYVEFSDHEIAGIDMVFIKNGYVYHTDIDDVKHVTSGTLQHLGNNLLPTIRELASSPYLVDAVHYKDKTAIFFDIAGVLLVVFPDKTVARVWYIVLLIATLVDFFIQESKKKKKDQENNSMLLYLSIVLQWCVLLIYQIVIVMCGIVFSILTGELFALTGYSMSWFSSLYLTWFLFAASSLCGVCMGRFVIVKYCNTFDVASASSALWWLLLLLAVYVNAQSAYLPAVPLFFQLLGSIVKKRISIFPPIAIELIVHFLPCILMTQYYCTIGTFFVPITGRIGDWIPSDILVAVLLGTVGSLTWTIPTISLHANNNGIKNSTIEKKPKAEKKAKKAKVDKIFKTQAPKTLVSCLFISLFVTILLFFILIQQMPYTKERPKRLYVQQVSRKIHGLITQPNKQPNVVDSDQGLWVNAFDHRGLSPDISSLNIPEFSKNKKDVACQTDKVYCGWPWYFPIQEMLTKQWYVPVELKFPMEKDLFQLTLTSKTKIKNGGYRLEFIGTGSSHMTTVIEGNITRWSFTADNVPYDNSKSCTDVTESGKDCRFVFFSTGKQMETKEWKFWLETPRQFEKENMEDEELGLRLAFYSHYGIDVMAESETLKNVRKKLPAWVTMASWVSYWNQYNF